MNAGSIKPNDNPSTEGKGNINPIFRRKAVYPITEDPWVEVLVKNNSPLLPEAPFSFHLQEIKGIRGIAPEYSALELENGQEHIFSLSHAALSDRIYAGDTAVIDLKDFSVTKGKQILLRELMNQAVKEGRITAPVWERGELVKDEGIFLGQYEPRAPAGESLGRVFNVFAAPVDLPGQNTYQDAATAVSRLRHWQGHDGDRYYADEDGIRAALENGSYQGGWIIPPRDILVGTVKEVMTDSLYGSRNERAFANTFARSGRTNAEWYWSSTRQTPESNDVWIQRFKAEGEGKFFSKEGSALEVRPVRLVPAF